MYSQTWPSPVFGFKRAHNLYLIPDLPTVKVFNMLDEYGEDPADKFPTKYSGRPRHQQRSHTTKIDSKWVTAARLYEDPLNRLYHNI